MNLFPTPSIPYRHQLQVGQAVHVNARIWWLPAVVTFIAPTLVGVDYATGFPTMLSNQVAPWGVLPADGIRLKYPHELCADDEVVAFDGRIYIVDTAWRIRNGSWLVIYRDGSKVVLLTHAMLRLQDPTPQVTVDGKPLGDTY